MTTRIRRRLAALALAALACPPAASAPRRSVVIISVDMLRADALGAYGARPTASPRLDRLARSALVFRRAYSDATFTLPSHMSLLSGLTTFEHGFMHNTANEGRPPRLLTSAFREAGYRTAAFTSGFVVEPVFGAGFEHYENYGHEANDAGLGFREARRWLAAGDPGRPYFVFIHTYHVHNHYRDAAGKRADDEGDYVKSAGDPDWLARYRQSYASAVVQADAAIGEFLASLDTATIVAVVSDHGQSMAEPQAGGWVGVGHRHPWEPAVRVPLLLRLGSASGAARALSWALDRPVQLHRLAATLAELAGVPFASGRSLTDGRADGALAFLGRGERCTVGLLRGDRKVVRILVLRRGAEPGYLYFRADPAGVDRSWSPSAEEKSALDREVDAVVKAGHDPCALPKLTPAVEAELRAAGYLP